jgi:uncharacterized protein
MRTIIAWVVLVSVAAAAPMPDAVRDAVQQVRLADAVAPRQPYSVLAQFTPRADAEQRAALAALLARAVDEPDTTAVGRTILCQQLALVAGPAEMPLVSKWLGPLAGAAGTAASKEELLAEAAGSNAAARVAGLSALARWYPGESGPALLKAVSDPDPVVAATAIQLAGRLAGPGLAAQLPGLDVIRQALALPVLAECRVIAARQAVGELAGSGDAAVRQAAIEALGSIGDAGSVPILARLSADKALARLDGPGVDEAILRGIREGEPAARPTCIAASAARGSANATAAWMAAAREDDSSVREAAIKALGQSGDASAYPQLVEMLAADPSPGLEVALVVLGRRLPDADARIAPLLTFLKRDGLRVESQGAAMRQLAAIGGAGALVPVQDRLASADARVRDAAVRALCNWADWSAMEDLKRIADDASADEVHRTLAQRAIKRLSDRVPLIARLPAGARPMAYLDCGPATQAVGTGGVRLGVKPCRSWTYTDEPAGTVVYDADKVVVELGGLDAKENCQLWFTWWDYDSNGRAQSVWIGGRQIIPKTALPQGTAGPASLMAAIPADAISNGNVTVEFRREASSNVSVSELCVVEAAAAAVAPAVTEAPAVKTNPGAARKVLIVTGRDLHDWRQTTPVLTAALAEDGRLEISVVEDASFLSSPELKRYAAIVLHYQNWQAPDPGAAALANLAKYVNDGGGFVMAHFSCGAFIDWSTKTVRRELLPIAGRVWNPQLRGHDPRGAFRVNIVDPEHPITKGLADFDADDELYTCLEGDLPIRILAKATSKVDQKDYPMAFVLAPGKGRAFHCVLGHDVKALSIPAVGQLFRRGTAWAAGLDPAEKENGR